MINNQNNTSSTNGVSQGDVEIRVQKLKDTLKSKNFFKFQIEVEENIPQEEPLQLSKVGSSAYSRLNPQIINKFYIIDGESVCISECYKQQKIDGYIKAL